MRPCIHNNLLNKGQYANLIPAGNISLAFSLFHVWHLREFNADAEFTPTTEELNPKSNAEFQTFVKDILHSLKPKGMAHDIIINFRNPIIIEISNYI